MSGAGPAADPTGIFATTGNGVADSNQDFGDSLLRLTPQSLNQPLITVADSFTPQTQSMLACDDLDFGSSGPVLIPGSAQLMGMHQRSCAARSGLFELA